MDSSTVYTIARHALHCQPTFDEDCTYLGDEEKALVIFDAKLWAVFSVMDPDARQLGAAAAFPVFRAYIVQARDLILNTDADTDAALGIYVRTVDLLERVLAQGVCRG